MKKFAIILILTISMHSIAQNYQLFPSDYDRIYTIPFTADSCFEISFDSVRSENNTTTYYNYFDVGNLYESENCDFWGGNECNQQNSASWIGEKIVKDPNGKYYFFNHFGDTLKFNFLPILNEEQLIYEDEEQSFYIEYTGTNITQILGVYDSIRSFKIHHYDINGNIIESALNNFSINIGKIMGLANFFMVDQFPDILQPLHLGGTNNHGISSITEASLHYHEIGDKIQYKESKFRYDGPPWDNYIKFTLYTYLNKWEENNAINYTAQRTIHYQNSTSQTIDTIDLSYSFFDTIAKLPFEKPDQNEVLYSKSIYFQQYTDYPMLAYEKKLQNLIYCVEDNCWGSFDIYNSLFQEEIKYVDGLGVFYYLSIDSPFPDHTFFSDEIIYFEKYGQTYGTELILSTKENIFNSKLDVYPQPAIDRIIFSNREGNVITKLKIFELSGKMIANINVNEIQYAWDCSHLNAGVYFYQSEINGTFFRGKIIIQ